MKRQMNMKMDMKLKMKSSMRMHMGINIQLNMKMSMKEKKHHLSIMMKIKMRALPSSTTKTIMQVCCRSDLNHRLGSHLALHASALGKQAMIRSKHFSKFAPALRLPTQQINIACPQLDGSEIKP